MLEPCIDNSKFNCQVLYNEILSFYLRLFSQERQNGGLGKRGGPMLPSHTPQTMKKSNNKIQIDR